jgi:lambda repressor-like predicted transcriptional regulator
MNENNVNLKEELIKLIVNHEGPIDIPTFVKTCCTFKGKSFSDTGYHRKRVSQVLNEEKRFNPVIARSLAKLIGSKPSIIWPDKFTKKAA